jgi:hypothetical protein
MACNSETSHNWEENPQYYITSVITESHVEAATATSHIDNFDVAFFNNAEQQSACLSIACEPQTIEDTLSRLCEQQQLQTREGEAEADCRSTTANMPQAPTNNTTSSGAPDFNIDFFLMEQTDGVEMESMNIPFPEPNSAARYHHPLAPTPTNYTRPELVGCFDKIMGTLDNIDLLGLDKARYDKWLEDLTQEKTVKEMKETIYRTRYGVRGPEQGKYIDNFKATEESRLFSQMRFILAEIELALLFKMHEKGLLFPDDQNESLRILQQKKNNLCVLAWNEEGVIRRNLECLDRPEDFYKYERYLAETKLKDIIKTNLRYEK